jgi:hypothetical protein
MRDVPDYAVVPKPNFAAVMVLGSKKQDQKKR